MGVECLAVNRLGQPTTKFGYNALVESKEKDGQASVGKSIGALHDSGGFTATCNCVDCETTEVGICYPCENVLLKDRPFCVVVCHNSFVFCV